MPAQASSATRNAGSRERPNESLNGKRANCSGVKEDCRRANVSTATVDRVLHNRTGVSEKTKARINAIIKEMDYQPNILGKSAGI